jgi:hypothetical protein
MCDKYTTCNNKGTSMSGATLGIFFSEDNSNNYDKECFDAIETHVNMLVPWYLMAAYAYYVEDNPIISDQLFDNMSKRLLASWDIIEHMHKHHLTRGDLEAGTFLGKYPTRIKGALKSLRSIKR